MEVDKDNEAMSGGVKRTSHEERCRSSGGGGGGVDRDRKGHSHESGHVACHDELCARRFLRLCYFPVFWTHAYRCVLAFLNVPQRFQESEAELQQRMHEMVLKYGRLNLPLCVFHSSMDELIWSVESGRRKRVSEIMLHVKK